MGKLKMTGDEFVEWAWKPTQRGWIRCSATGLRHTDREMQPRLRRRRKGGRKLRCGACGKNLPARITTLREWLRRERT